MKVARQFIAWDVSKKSDPPEGRCEPRYPMYWLPQVEERPVDPIIPSRFLRSLVGSSDSERSRRNEVPPINRPLA